MNIFEQVINNTNGRFFTVTFIKNDGSTRTLNGRMGVKKGRSILNVKPKTSAQDQYITVYDVQAKGYRSVNKNTIRSVTTDGVTVIRNGS